ncbi:MAG: hypothetical protein H5T64_00940 [Chloroflexi bacterium]|nr:hypothetical protein [Chloroflexota bacterium]
MSTNEVWVLIMAGIHSGDEAVNMVAGARQAITLDLVERALAIPGVDHVLVSTNSPALAERLSTYPVIIEMDSAGETFHFGKRLRDLVCRHHMKRVFYLGGGSGALLNPGQMTHIIDDLRRGEQVLITNNFYSTDFAAFAPATVLESVAPPANDNDLGWTLGEHAGLPNRSLPRCAATLLDVDTPTDLMTIASHPGVGPHTRAYLDSLALDLSHIQRAMAVFVDREAEAIIAGRVGAETWAYLERETACRTRIFAEERGMRASGRLAQERVRSLLGEYLRLVGAERFFEALAWMGQAAFIDSRVIFAHLGVWPPAADRYNSDLLRPERIADPFVREFTAAAITAPIPVVLGGHSLVSGGLYALVEAAWAHSGVNVPRYVDHTIWEQPGH